MSIHFGIIKIAPHLRESLEYSRNIFKNINSYPIPHICRTRFVGFHCRTVIFPTWLVAYLCAIFRAQLCMHTKQCWQTKRRNKHKRQTSNYTQNKTKVKKKLQFISLCDFLPVQVSTKWILNGRKLVHCNSYLWVHVSVSLFVFLVKIHSCFVTSNKCHANHCEYFIWTNHRRLDVFQCQCKHVIVFRMPFFFSFVILIIYILFT